MHQSSTGSALVTYFGFISIFPLFLVFTTVLGFVLEGNPDLREDIVDSALAKLPLIGPKLAASLEALEGSVVALVVGLLLALWSGTKAFIALQTALDNTNEVPVDDRNSFVQVRVRALGGIVVIGLAQAGSAALSGIVAAAGLPALGNVGLVGAAALLNALVLSFSYRWLTSRALTWRSVVPGSVFAGVLFSLLQVVGSSIITRSQSNAESMYGDFATVIALLGWLSLHATVALMGAELNRALATSPYDGDGEARCPWLPRPSGRWTRRHPPRHPPRRSPPGQQSPGCTATSEASTGRARCCSTGRGRTRAPRRGRARARRGGRRRRRRRRRRPIGRAGAARHGGRRRGASTGRAGQGPHGGDRRRRAARAHGARRCRHRSSHGRRGRPVHLSACPARGRRAPRPRRRRPTPAAAPVERRCPQSSVRARRRSRSSDTVGLGRGSLEPATTPRRYRTGQRSCIPTRR
ncbi:MAG: YihY/virulence factor BrkB family protein [Ilumatobacteraceae bacterium]